MRIEKDCPCLEGKMAFVTLYISASVAALLILYAVCFTGRRGRHFPDGTCRTYFEMYIVAAANVL
jgi:hypothetical protein